MGWWLFVRGALAASWYADADGDGYGDPSATVEADTAPPGYVADDTDCNDADPAVSPSAVDTCDGVDNDCNDAADDGGDCPTECTVEYFGTHTYLFCENELSWSDAEAQCQTVGYHLAGVNSTEENAWVDATADSYSTSKWWFGFNDIDAEGTWEWIDGSSVSFANWHAGEPNDSGGNEDCGQFNRYTDLTWNDEPCTYTLRSICEYATPINWYLDGDGDGFGDLSSSFWSSDQPAGYVEDSTDCDDGDVAVFPGAEEVCDGVDQDCDGTADEGLPTSTYYPDADADGYGDGGLPTSACGPTPGYVTDATDCDDSDIGANPGATERPGDSVDSDCDGGEICFTDADGDTYGAEPVDGSYTISADSDCADAGEADETADCDDTDPSVHDGAPDDDCDGVDDDCDGVPDDGLAVGDWYADADGDGFGDASDVVSSCTPPLGYVSDSTDCNDTDASVNPVAIEICDGVDQDCDGAIDDGAPDTTWYADADGDGYGDPGKTRDACSPPEGYVEFGTDCDDKDPTIHSAAPEVTADGVDQDCDGGDDCFRDGDADGYGAPGGGWPSRDLDCADAEESYNDLDCDDSSALVHPGMPEIFDDFRDNDCDGFSDEEEDLDTDGDGLDDAEEAAIGTDPNDPDTDKDGLSDGEEVHDHKTDPLKPDTDNGGVKDGAEVARGSDPLDPSDDKGPPDDTDPPDTGDPGDTDDTDPGDTDPGDTDDTDPGDTDDTDGGGDTDPADTDPASGRAWGGGGCKCDSRGSGGAWALAGLALLAVRRRRS